MNFLIPSQYDDQSRPTVRNCLTGIDSDIDLLILTPLRVFFDRIGREGTVVSEGWWASRLCPRANTALVLVPQGTPIIDMLASLEPGTSVIFAGLAGAVGGVAVGDVLQIEKALLCDKCYEPTMMIESGFRRASIATVFSMRESEVRAPELSRLVDCVDMETGVVFAAAQSYSLRCASLQVVSDHVLESRYYDTGSQDAAIDALSGWIANLVGPKWLGHTNQMC